MATNEGLSADILVGIVAYNTDIAVVRRTLASVRQQEVSCHVCLYCNSPDAAYQNACRALAAEFGAVCFTDMPNRGFGAAHNYIAHQYPGPYMLYVCCNPDVTLERNTLSELLTASLRLHNWVQLSPKILNSDGSLQRLARRHITLGNLILRQFSPFLPRWLRSYEHSFDYECTQPIEFVSGCFFMIKREVFLAVGGFDENFFLYCEDADLSRRGGALGTHYYVASAQVTHRWQKDSHSSMPVLILQLKALRLYFKKYGLFATRTSEAKKIDGHLEGERSPSAHISR